MATLVRDLMTPDPFVLDADRSIIDAATTMRDADVGAVLVRRDGELCGVLTDRDIVARVIADARDPRDTRVEEACSEDLHALPSDATLADAVGMMRNHAIRRVPIVDDGDPVGILSIGDLAVAADPQSALADISSAPPNH